MKFNKISIFSGLLTFVLGTGMLLSNANTLNVLADGSPASQSGVNIRCIETVEDLNLLREIPEGSFALMNDLDMEGIDWEPVDFSGTLDGNNHSILNLKVVDLGKETRITYDGNYKEYDTSFAGMFGCLENATIKNLNLVNLVVDVNEDKDTFIGGFAGFATNSTITDCTLTARLNMSVSCKMFGVGGAVGFGDGKLENCTINTVMIAEDRDRENRDESFLGGAEGAGHLDVVNCDITLDGYLSDTGYVHSGGLIGMYIKAKGDPYFGKITDNIVNGKITFYENNTNRRAYCEGDIGEIMVWDFERGRNNLSGFLRDEKFEYDKTLRPNMCENPEYTEQVTPFSVNDFGYTTYKCKTCDYSYKDNYRLADSYYEAINQAKLDKIAAEQAELVDKINAEAANEQANSQPNTSNVSDTLARALITVLIALGVLLVVLLAYVIRRR